MMLPLLSLIPGFPLVGFALLALAGGRLSPRQIAWIGTGSIGASGLVAALVGIDVLSGLPETTHYRQTLWTWIDTAGFTAGVTWYLDALSLLMTVVITGVGFLIHLYSVEYMAGDEGYRRFFAYMNLFVASMLILVLADNLLLLYLGWEGVGLCSYLLIGFWYRQSENGTAAQKAFLVTRAGDTAFAIALFLLFATLGTLSIQQVQILAVAAWPPGSTVAIAVAALLLVGAIGKSAQLPLHVWLPDAMAGPTPVSALIHAATMVTAGVYLIARMHALFSLAPPVLHAVAVIGVLTLLGAACSALVQRDIKRILAYSTISQIGYMFLALGVGAWSAAMFHFLTHACFKALLFLAAGAVILGLDHEQDIGRMGGLRRHLRLPFWASLAGAGALAGVPLVTSGFFSKEWILEAAWHSPLGGPWLWLGGALGALLTGLYSFRLIFTVFFGPLRTAPHERRGAALSFPLALLAVLAVAIGWLQWPRELAEVHAFSRFMSSALPALEAPSNPGGVQTAAVSLLSLLGIALAAWLYLPTPKPADRLLHVPAVLALRRYWLEGWRIDRVYQWLVLRPWEWITRDAMDRIDSLYAILARMAADLHAILSRTQTGQVRWYAASVAMGALALIGWIAL
jgi:NADH-quinone oxidoreductase subunit L